MTYWELLQFVDFTEIFHSASRHLRPKLIVVHDHILAIKFHQKKGSLLGTISCICKYHSEFNAGALLVFPIARQRANHGDLNVAIAHDNEGGPFKDVAVGNGVAQLALLTGWLKLCGMEAFRPGNFELPTSHFQFMMAQDAQQ